MSYSILLLFCCLRGVCVQMPAKRPPAPLLPRSLARVSRTTKKHRFYRSARPCRLARSFQSTILHRLRRIRLLPSTSPREQYLLRSCGPCVATALTSSRVYETPPTGTVRATTATVDETVRIFEPDNFCVWELHRACDDVFHRARRQERSLGGRTTKRIGL